MELIEVVDENGNFTGEVLDREEVHNRNLLHNEVAVFIINDNGETLLQRRSPNKRFNANKWAICAGHVDAYESIEDAAIREVKEEIGLVIPKDKLYKYDDVEFVIRDTNSHLTHYFYAKTNKKESEFIIQKEELSEVKWIKIDEVINRIKNHDETLIFGENRIKLFEGLKRL